MRCQPGQRLPAARSGTTSLKGGDHRAGTERQAPVEADSDALQANTGKTEHHGPAVIEQRERFADAHPSAEALQDCTPSHEAKYLFETLTKRGFHACIQSGRSITPEVKG